MKPDLATEQPISKQKDSGKTDSDSTPKPHWHRGPKELSTKEDLRRRHKKLFGYKPCGMSVEMLKRLVLNAEEQISQHTTTVTEDPGSRVTIGDALQYKR